MSNTFRKNAPALKRATTAMSCQSHWGSPAELILTGRDPGQSYWRSSGGDVPPQSPALWTQGFVQLSDLENKFAAYFFGHLFGKYYTLAPSVQFCSCCIFFCHTVHVFPACVCVCVSCRKSSDFPPLLFYPSIICSLEHLDRLLLWFSL